MTRIEEIAAKHKGYEDETRPTCDVNFLLDELKNRDEKLAAVEEWAVHNVQPCPEPDGCADCQLWWSILHPKGE